MFAFPSCKNQDAPPNPPNIVLINCDDLGYGDLGVYGSTKHRTLHLDQMAAEGIRLTDFYSTSSVCTPSRSSLLTGCYPRRVNMHQNARPPEGTEGWMVVFPVAQRGLHPNEITIAEMLKQKDYATACIGKWHLGDQPEFLPTHQGFDYYYGIPYSNDMGTGQFADINPPLPLMRNEEVIEAPAEQSTLTKEDSGSALRETFFYYRVEQLQAARSGRWKLYLGRDDWRKISWNLDREKSEMKLFDLEEDISEENNVADQYPDVVQRLVKIADEMINDIGDTRKEGANQREAGHTEMPKALVMKTTNSGR